MADITISYQQIGEENLVEIGSSRIQELMKRLEPGLNLVKKTCEEKFPHLEVEWECLDPDCFIYEELYDDIWQAYGWIEVRTVLTSKNSSEKTEVDKPDRWHEEGEPLYTEVAEYLYDADWSLIKRFCDGDLVGAGETIQVTFDVIKAVESYKQGETFHFYFNQYSL